MYKSVIFLVWSILFSFGSLGNGGPPSVFINELKFDSVGNWIIEFKFYFPEYIDSIRISSSTGTTIITNWTLLPQDLAVITESDLDEPVVIIPGGDRIITMSYSNGFYNPDSIIFGDYPGSWLDCLEEGESYAYVYQLPPDYASCFAIDNAPSIGLLNNSIGALTTFSGMVYDPEGEVMTEGDFGFVMNSLKIYIQPDGSFSELIPARRYTCEQITVRSPYPYYLTDYTIVRIDTCMRPDSSYQIDFVTTGYVNYQEYDRKFEKSLIVSPNPFSSRINFYWDDQFFASESSIHLIISDQQGKEIFKTLLSPGLMRYSWTTDSQLPSGLYLYNLKSNDRVLASGKIIKIQ